MASRSKRLIPVELLRRSNRNRNQCDLSTTSTRLIEQRRVVSEESMIKTNHGSPDNLNYKKPINIEHIDVDGFLLVDKQELDLERTLLGGQSFRWTKSTRNAKNQAIFTGVVGRHALQLWRLDDVRIAFKKLNVEDTQDPNDVKSFLEDYFQLKYKIKDLYDQWSTRDANLKKCCINYTGFRILRQDPIENVFSFICATCNNIKRISQMIEKMCTKFGDNLEPKQNITSRGDEHVTNSFRTFPNIERLTEGDVFQCLRFELGFGYRAKFIIETAKQVIKLTKEKNFNSPRDYLLSLRQLPYKETCKQLQQFAGIGRKVADCICLMSMDHLSAIPVDCHIYEIFCRNYMPNLRQERKSVTEAVHDLIGDYFNELHGPLAGWSTSVLFIAELKHLKAPRTVNELLDKNWSKRGKIASQDESPSQLKKKNKFS